MKKIALFVLVVLFMAVSCKYSDTNYIGDTELIDFFVPDEE